MEQFHYQVLINKFQEIIGVVGIRLPSHIYHLHIAAKYHRMGLGEKLWSSVKDNAYGKVNEFTVNSSIYAAPFYKKMGFVAGPKQFQNEVAFIPMKFNYNN